MLDGEPIEQTLRRALSGDPSAARALVARLAPIIQARVVRALWRRRGDAGERDPNQEVDDMTQEVFAALFAEGGRALRGWDPARGLSLTNFVGLVAERQVGMIMRTGRRSPWTEDPTDDLALADAAGDEPIGEVALLSRDLLVTLLERLRAELSPRGLHLFQLLIVEERPIDEIGAALQMNADALYAWRARLLRVARRIAAELESIPPSRTPVEHAREDEAIS
jgi:RNA polymerase sigma-70 factor (ECF subfamily)